MTHQAKGIDQNKKNQNSKNPAISGNDFQKSSIVKESGSDDSKKNPQRTSENDDENEPKLHEEIGRVEANMREEDLNSSSAQRPPFQYQKPKQIELPVNSQD